MGVLQVVGDRPQTGKTSLISALLIQLAEAGRPASYYKPFSSSPTEDSDVAFISRQLPENLGIPQPHPFPDSGSDPNLPDSLKQQIANTVAGLDAASQPVLVEGPDLRREGRESSLAPDLASLLDAKVILIVGYARGLESPAVTQAAAGFGARLAGVVINNVGQHRRQEINGGVAGEWRTQSIPILGAIPEDRTMLAVTVQQIADFLGAAWVQEPVNTDAWVDRFLIGGNIMDSGINYFGRYTNQAVITRAERPDIQMASLLPGTKCLILTGGTEPTEYIRVEAAKREVPLLLVDQDTLTAAEALGDLLDLAHPHDQFKAQQFRELVQRHLDLDLLNSVIDSL
ncbi:MAG: DRTGG domain-containing protein [Dehalococcoidia bacterium]